MSTSTQNQTESLVQGLLSDAATGASQTLDALRSGAARVGAAEQELLLKALRLQEARMDPTTPCGFFDPPFQSR